MAAFCSSVGQRSDWDGPTDGDDALYNKSAVKYFARFDGHIQRSCLSDYQRTIGTDFCCTLNRYHCSQ
jgi:hypothetical protein